MNESCSSFKSCFAQGLVGNSDQLNESWLWRTKNNVYKKRGRRKKQLHRHEVFVVFLFVFACPDPEDNSSKNGHMLLWNGSTQSHSVLINIRLLFLLFWMGCRMILLRMPARDTKWWGVVVFSITKKSEKKNQTRFFFFFFYWCLVPVYVHSSFCPDLFVVWWFMCIALFVYIHTMCIPPLSMYLYVKTQMELECFNRSILGCWHFAAHCRWRKSSTINMRAVVNVKIDHDPF